LDYYFHGNNDLDRLEDDSIKFTYEHSDYQVLVLTGLNPPYACKKRAGRWDAVYTLRLPFTATMEKD
jgi:hypothetical protein